MFVCQGRWVTENIHTLNDQNLHDLVVVLDQVRTFLIPSLSLLGGKTNWKFNFYLQVPTSNFWYHFLGQIHPDFELIMASSLKLVESINKEFVPFYCYLPIALGVNFGSKLWYEALWTHSVCHWHELINRTTPGFVYYFCLKLGAVSSSKGLAFRKSLLLYETHGCPSTAFNQPIDQSKFKLIDKSPKLYSLNLRTKVYSINQTSQHASTTKLWHGVDLPQISGWTSCRS